MMLADRERTPLLVASIKLEKERSNKMPKYGILLDKPVNAKVKTILIPWESAKCIKEYEHAHGRYSDKPIKDEHWDKLKREFDRSSHDGIRQYTSDSFGYVTGTGYGTWHRLSIEDVSKILDDHGLPYKIGDPIEVIYI